MTINHSLLVYSCTINGQNKYPELNFLLLEKDEIWQITKRGVTF